MKVGASACQLGWGCEGGGQHTKVGGQCTWEKSRAHWWGLGHIGGELRCAVGGGGGKTHGGGLRHVVGALDASGGGQVNLQG